MTHTPQTHTGKKKIGFVSYYETAQSHLFFPGIASFPGTAMISKAECGVLRVTERELYRTRSASISSTHLQISEPKLKASMQYINSPASPFSTGAVQFPWRSRHLTQENCETQKKDSWCNCVVQERWNRKC